jgi:hypothetical protein
MLLIEATAPFAATLMGAKGEVHDGAVTYLRIAALGGPLFMLASAGQGFLRGMSDLKTPLLILVAAHTVNAILEVVFVYGFDWGLKGSAWGTVIAQLGMALAFVAVQRARGFERPHLAKMRPLMRIGSEIAVRTTALTGSFLVGSAVLAADRRGAARRAPDRVPALGLPRARARRDRDRRAGDGRAACSAPATRPARASAATRMIGWSVASARCSRRSASRSATSSRALHRRPRGDRQGARDLAAVRADDARQRAPCSRSTGS